MGSGWDQRWDFERQPIEVPSWLKRYMLGLAFAVAAFGIWSLR